MAAELVERHILDGAVLEWKESGTHAWAPCTTHRCTSIVSVINRQSDFTQFACGRAGSCLKYFYSRFQGGMLVFKPARRFDCYGQRRRNVQVRAVDAGTLALNVTGEIQHGRLHIEGCALSGATIYSGRYSLQWRITAGTLKGDIKAVLRRQRKITKYTCISLTNGGGILKTNHKVWDPAWRNVRIRLWRKGSPEQASLDRYFNRS
jgi:hypothetical protein